MCCRVLFPHQTARSGGIFLLQLELLSAVESSNMSARVGPLPALTHRSSSIRHERYSVEKFFALESYIHTTSLARVISVLLYTPLPGLVGAVLPNLVPLDSISEGPNLHFVLYTFVLAFLTAVGAVVAALDATHVPSKVYSLREIVLVSAISSAIYNATSYPIWAYWRFPTPFMSVVCMPEWFLGFVVGHLVVLGRKIWREDALRRCIQVYPPVLTIMICQLALYPAFSVVFDQASGTVQVLLTIVFPALKYLMKKILHRYTSQLGEFSVEVAVSGVEIASSLYQSMIMQTAPSALAMGIIMGVDVVLGVVSVKFVMDKQSAIPKSQLIRRAYEILEIKTPSSTAELSTLPSKGSNTLPATSSTVPAGPLPVLEEEISPTTVVTPIADDVVVRQALELASAAESVLLVEYFEVIVPIINCLFLVIGSTLPATQYNTRLAGFYRQPAAVAKAAKSILMYSFLQLLSCVAMHFVMKYRYGMSAAYQLSFVLERHGRSIQGKMLAWLPVIISFSLVHGGVDFSFKFNFSKGG